MANILIACGHDIYGNGGAINNKYGTEQILTRDFSKILVKPLRDKGHTVTVFNVSTKDKSLYTSLTKNLIDKNKLKKYDYVIELHFNACVDDLKGDNKITGTEILIDKSNKDTKMICNILKELDKIGLKSRGVKYRNDLYNMNVCKSLNVSYLLWEICFIDDEDDMKLYINNKEKIAKIFSDNFK